MYTRIDVLAVICTTGLLVLIFELVRRRRLKEKYSLLWVFTALVLLLLSASKGLLAKVSAVMGIFYPPSAFFLLAFLFLLLITLQFSVVISRLSERNKVLAQEVALLKLRMKDLERENGKAG